MKILTIILLTLTFSLVIADEKIVHVVGPGGDTYEKLSKHKIQQRLIDKAEKYKNYVLDRATHHDMAFPRDEEEYLLMNGFGIMWVTSHSKVQAELPIRNLRIVIGETGTIGLDPVYTFPSEEKNKLVANILGQYRSDSIYLIPFFVETKGGTLVADYAINRKDFVLGKMINDFPFKLASPKKLSNQVVYPKKDIFHSMLKREYPIAMPLITSIDKPNKSLQEDASKAGASE